MQGTTREKKMTDADTIAALRLALEEIREDAACAAGLDCDNRRESLLWIKSRALEALKETRLQTPKRNPR